VTWGERADEQERRDATYAFRFWAGQIWTSSELVVILLNRRRRALHDFIAGTVVVRVR
jgi:uncharacterized RDD family membrane protein YckC